MKFYSLNSLEAADEIQSKSVYLVLIPKKWNDYGHTILHRLYVYQPEKNEREYIGETKILCKGSTSSGLEQTFTKLNTKQISLGQNLDFYRRARKLLGDNAQKVLEKLNDISVKKALAEPFQVDSGFRNALIRMGDAKVAQHQGHIVLKGRTPQKSFSFNYTCELPGADEPLEVDFDFTKNSKIPYRISALIGRNGVGKTRLLSKLARDLAPNRELSEDEAQEISDAFKPRPLFSRVIALSFSTFDKFERPEKTEYFSYIYCGARDESGLLSNESMEARFSEYIARIREMHEFSLWKEYLCEITEKSEDELNELFGSTEDEFSAQNLSLLSSGQAIVAYCVAAAIAYLQSGALILFDEPELHLHPDAITTLMRILHELVKKFDAYAILATHSPIVIQEISGNQVIKLTRSGNATIAESLPHESFGESVTTLTSLTFETIENKPHYQKVLENLSIDYEFEEVMEFFNNELSLNAASYLSSLYEKKPKNKK